MLRILVSAAIALAATTTNGAQDNVAERLVEEIATDAAATASYTGQSEISRPVLDAIAAVPRERFVPKAASAYAYENRPLAIGHGQTISQPFIVALMTDLLNPDATHRVLEIGTGSGYQAAVLAQLVDTVHTIEIIPELAATATTVLEAQGYARVHVHIGDGWHGWPTAAPYDGIIVTAVAPEIPPRLIDQLADGGRLVMPIGDTGGHQELVVIEKRSDGSLDRRDVLPVQFVPLTGEH